MLAIEPPNDATRGSARRLTEADITGEDVAYQESLGLPKSPPFVVVLGASLNLR